MKYGDGRAHCSIGWRRTALGLGVRSASAKETFAFTRGGGCVVARVAVVRRASRGFRKEPSGTLEEITLTGRS